MVSSTNGDPEATEPLGTPPETELPWRDAHSIDPSRVTAVFGEVNRAAGGARGGAATGGPTGTVPLCPDPLVLRPLLRVFVPVAWLELDMVEVSDRIGAAGAPRPT